MAEARKVPRVRHALADGDRLLHRPLRTQGSSGSGSGGAPSHIEWEHIEGETFVRPAAESGSPARPHRQLLLLQRSQVARRGPTVCFVLHVHIRTSLLDVSNPGCMAALGYFVRSGDIERCMVCSRFYCVQTLPIGERCLSFRYHVMEVEKVCSEFGLNQDTSACPKHLK